MSFTKADLKRFYFRGYISGFGNRSEDDPTVEDIDGWFESSYQQWRKDAPLKQKDYTTAQYRAWISAGKPAEGAPMFPELYDNATLDDFPLKRPGKR